MYRVHGPIYQRGRDAVEMREQMTGDGLPKVSVVFPVYNEEGNLEVLYERVREAFLNTDVTYEMVFVDDCSSDGSLEIIRKLSQRDPCVRYVSLSKNFGHQGGPVRRNELQLRRRGHHHGCRLAAPPFSDPGDGPALAAGV